MCLEIVKLHRRNTRVVQSSFSSNKWKSVFQVLKHPEKSFRNGQAISATVTGTDVTETNLCLSLTGIVETSQQDPTAYVLFRD